MCYASFDDDTTTAMMLAFSVFERPNLVCTRCALRARVAVSMPPTAQDCQCPHLNHTDVMQWIDLTTNRLTEIDERILRLRGTWWFPLKLVGTLAQLLGAAESPMEGAQ